MTLPALQHLLRAARALAEDRRFLVLGSASLLVSFPDLGEVDAPLASTYDADLCPEPFDELTGRMLEEALGENQSYHRRHGYHVDVLREAIYETLPTGWRDRLLAIPGAEYAVALEPHDLAAAKLWVGRPKDLALVRKLVTDSQLDPDTLRARLEALSTTAEARTRLLANFDSVTS